ncbi:triose-phosphate isomerase [Orrella daihaiensis]|uniref:Triosephosphate isomerase n=1 Tax=Orrella daihaiensis TaxID=2782176 RepID=A0ABY4AL81_9BURK|nr:triose-phosphate isomerase [Orrella daihaiensis]UOD51032.1 triose-phosphate isomerase [Orrella daihaiensis]
MTDASYKSDLVTRANKLVIGNWKMNGSMESNHALLDGVLVGLEQAGCKAVVAVCSPFPYLAQVAGLLKGTAVSWGAQDVSAHGQGAYTGEVSAAMLSEFGCRWAIVGHSERRAMHQESAQLVADKAEAAATVGLTPVFCVGETLAEREADRVQSVIAAQLAPLFAKGDDLVARTVVAYEPVWAIGTGKTASPEQAQQVHGFIRAQLPASAKSIPLLYGGSVKPDNAATLFAMDDIDGGLIGGAALVAKDFVAIAAA